MRKYYFYIIYLLFSITSLTAQSETKIVKVGAFPHTPAIFRDSNGVVKGFYVDLLEEIAKKENLKIEYVWGSWDDGINRIKSEEVDIITSAAYTKERAEFMDYGIESSYTVWSILYCGHSIKINDIFDVRAKKVGLMKNDMNAKHFVELCDKFGIEIIKVEMSTFLDIFKAIELGNVDCGVAPNTFGYSNETKFDVHRTTLVFNPFNLFFCSKKDKNGDILSTIDKYLQEWKTDKHSFYYITINKWLGSEPNWKMPSWIIYFLIIVSGSLIISFLIIVVIRKQVVKATAKIKTINIELESEIKERKDNERTLKAIVEGTSGVVGAEYFQNLIKYLAEFSNSSYAFISESDGDLISAKTIAFFANGKFERNFVYNLNETPCYEVIKKGLCIYNGNVTESFPNDKLLQEINADSYIGAPLVDKNGINKGILAIINESPIQNPDMVISLMTVFSVRAALEIERKNYENELKASENRFRSFFEASPIAIFLSKNGNFLYVNNSFLKIFNYPNQDSIVGKPIISIVAPKYRAEIISRNRDRENGIKVVDDYEIFGLKSDGKKFPFRIHVTTLSLNEGISTLGFIEDISNAKKAEMKIKTAQKKLFEANKLKTIILGNLGHELRTPLNGILGFAHLLKDELEDEDQKEMIGFIANSSLRLNKTLNSLLALTELESRARQINLTSISIEELVNLQTEITTPIYSNKDIIFDYRRIGEPVDIKVDVDLLNNIVFNLFDNAIKFTDKGKITISIGSEICPINDKLCGVIKIADTGIGIGKDKLKTIFDPFRQASEGISRTHEGVGIGLTITKKMIELMEGQISISSELGKGTEVSIWLPIIK